MAKSKPEVVEEELINTGRVTDGEVSVATKSARTSVTVVWRSGSREYSEAVHGADFMALATEFAEKKKGTLV